MDITSGRAEVNGTKLYYQTASAGMAAVFLNSEMLDLRMWDDQFELFAAHHRVIRYDQRDFGQSEPAREKFSPVEDLYQLLQFLKVPRAHLIGCSFGGGVAVDFALAHPEMVDTLVLVGPTLSGFQFSEDMRKRLENLLAAKSEGADKFVKGLLADPHFIPATTHPSARDKVRQILTENFQHFLAEGDFAQPPAQPALGRLAGIRAPTIILVGGRDHPDQFTLANALESGIPGAKTLLFFGAGHLVNLEKPQEFNKAVMRFLERRSMED